MPGFPNTSGFRGYLSTRRDPGAECPHLPCVWEVYCWGCKTKLHVQRKETTSNQASTASQAVSWLFGRLDTKRMVLGAVKYDPIWPYKLDVINNWYILYNKNRLESQCPNKEPVLPWDVTRRQRPPARGPVHTKAGWSRERPFPAPGSGKAQREDDTDLWIRGRIWTASD